ncbi:MAG: hypothetical protein M0P13_10345 [Fibrobacteraceae bacterium]|nr:hypothetical protein [Fibrobacteraceae bacterium]
MNAFVLWGLFSLLLCSCATTRATSTLATDAVVAKKIHSSRDKIVELSLDFAGNNKPTVSSTADGDESFNDDAFALNFLAVSFSPWGYCWKNGGIFTSANIVPFAWSAGLSASAVQWLGSFYGGAAYEVNFGMYSGERYVSDSEKVAVHSSEFYGLFNFSAGVLLPGDMFLLSLGVREVHIAAPDREQLLDLDLGGAHYYDVGFSYTDVVPYVGALWNSPGGFTGLGIEVGNWGTRDSFYFRFSVLFWLE